MTAALAATWAIWHGRRRLTRRDRAFAVYASVMVVVVVIAPLGRAVWIGLARPEVVAALAAATAPATWGNIVALIWIGSVLAGRARGPVILSPYLAHAVVASAVPRRFGLARPFVQAALVLVGFGVLCTSVVGASAFAQGLSSAGAALAFGAGGAVVGFIAAVMWLAGQALGARASTLLIGVLVTGTFVSMMWPASGAVVPWGWFGMLAPGGAASLWLLLPVLAAAVLAASAVPVLLDRLSAAVVVAQSLRWDSARTVAYGLDFSGATGLYRGQPRFGRRMRAVRDLRSFEARILVRDLFGALRTPGRVAIGCVVLVVAASLIVCAVAVPEIAVIAGAAAGLLLYAGLGPFTDGIRHAAETSGGLSVYGVGDARLMTAHLLLPLLVGALLVTVAVLVGASLLAAPALISGVAGAAGAVLCVVLRVADALKPPLPIGLLTPIPTPMGDPSSAVRLAWAADATITASLVGATAIMVGTTVVPIVVVAAAVVALAGRRWARR